MANVGNRSSVNLKTSVSVDTVNGDIYEFEDPNAPMIQNTGLFELGGLTNLNESENIFTGTGDRAYTDNGELLESVDAGGNLETIKVDGATVGTVSAYGVTNAIEVDGVDDTALTADGTYMTLKVAGSTVTLEERSFAKVLLHTRSITFTGLTPFLPFITSVGFIRYQNMHYADSQEFSLRLGDQFVVLQESNPSFVPAQGLASTSVLGTSSVNVMLVYSGFLIVAGDNGRVGSFDGTAWKNYDGSGLGSGPFFTALLNGNNIRSGALFAGSLVLGGNGGLIASYDGNVWHDYNSGTGISNNATVISTSTVLAMAAYSTTWLVVAGGGGLAGYWTGSAWVNYNATGTTVTDRLGPNSNAGVIGANDIRALYYDSINGNLLYAGIGGQLGTYNSTNPTIFKPFVAQTSIAAKVEWFGISSGTSSGTPIFASVGPQTGGVVAPVQTSVDGVTWTSRSSAVIMDGLSICFASISGTPTWVMVGAHSGTSAYKQSSPDAITWTSRGATSGTNNLNSVCFGGPVSGQLFVAVGGTGSAALIETSPDGTTWTGRTSGIPGALSMQSVCWSPALSLFVAVTNSASTPAVQTSPDGITWTSRTSIAGNWVSVCFNSSLGLFAAVGLNTGTSAVMTSPDGINWTSRTTPSAGGSGWSSICTAGTIFVACARSTSTSTAIMTSPDGINWTLRTSTAAAGTGWFGIWYDNTIGNGTIVCVGGSTGTTGAVQTSLLIDFSQSSGSTGWVFPPPASMPFNNATVLGANTIFAISKIGTQYVFGGQGGRIGSFNLSGNTFTNYNAGSGLSSNSVVLGTSDIRAIAAFGSTLVFAGGSGRIGSYDGTNFKNYDGTGTGAGVFNGGTIVGSGNTIIAAIQYGSLFWVGSSSGAVNETTSGNVIGPTYTDGTNVYANLLTAMTGTGYLYAYRYENGLYLVDLVNNSLNIIWTLNNATFFVTKLAGKYAWPQVSGGFTRHIVTGTPTVVSTDIQAISLTGYQAFTNVFTPGQTFTLSGLSVASISLGQVGWNYADAILVPTGLPTQSYNFYAPPPTTVGSKIQQITQGNTTTFINGYGKLTNGFGLTPSVPFEIRIGMISAANNSGNQAFLSAAIIDTQATDALGTLLTTIGEVDASYAPQVVLDTTVLYGYGGNFRIIRIGTAPTNRLQRVNDRFFKINTLSPTNLFDSSDRALLISSMDYNGRAFWVSTAAPSGSTLVVSLIQYPGAQAFPFSGSIDTGERIVNIPTPGIASVVPFGYRIPNTAALFPTYHVDTYVAGVYSFSTFNGGSQAAIADPAFPDYAPVPLLPIPLGAVYAEGTATIEGETLFLQPNYDGYQVGNSSANNASAAALGAFTSFTLFGQVYLFDGVQIYQATLTNNVLVSIVPLVYAQGMIFLSVSPTEAYFQSSFDNSIYTYDGGRTLTKVKALTNAGIIRTGKYSTIDNSLIMDTDGAFIWLRDGIITVNPKKANQTGIMRLWSTSSGLYITGAVGSWRYSYQPIAGSTIVPLSIQTAYFGQGKNEISVYLNWVFKIFIPNRLPFNIVVTEHGKDQDREYTNSQMVPVAASDIDSQGYYYLRVQPVFQRVLQQSFELDFTTNVVVLEINQLWQDAVDAVQSKTR